MGLIKAFKSVYYELEYDTTDAVLSCNLGVDSYTSTLFFLLCITCKTDAVFSCNLGTDCKNNYSSFRSVPPVKDINHTV